MKMVVYVCILIAFLTRLTSAQEQNKLIAAPKIIPPATEEMQNPDFWISRLKGDPDRVIMTPEQIRALNKKNRSRSPVRKNINGNMHTIKDVVDQGNFCGIHFYLEDPLSIKSITGDSLRVWFKLTREYVASGKFWDRRRLPYPEAVKRELIESTDEESIPATVRPRYGILVAHTLQRVVPTHEPVYRSQFSWLDAFQKAALETGMPVAILHQTKNGDWYYVKSEYSFGWIPATHVAEGSVKDIQRLAEPDEFIVALAHKIPVYANRECTTYIIDFYQGAKLKLVNKTTRGYEVLVPFRQADGSLEAAKGWVKPDADVSPGFQPYTRRNVINTIFRLLNRPYGWGGTGHERDCVGTIRSVYKTFGIFMPRWTTFELYSADHVYIFPEDTPKEVKYRYLDRCEPGITVCGFNWHVMLYLGTVDDVHYVIHSNGYSYHDEQGTEIRVARVSVNCTELEGGSDIERWTELSIFKP